LIYNFLDKFNNSSITSLLVIESDSILKIACEHPKIMIIEAINKSLKSCALFRIENYNRNTTEKTNEQKEEIQRTRNIIFTETLIVEDFINIKRNGTGRRSIKSTDFYEYITDQNPKLGFNIDSFKPTYSTWLKTEGMATRAYFDMLKIKHIDTPDVLEKIFKVKELKEKYKNILGEK